MISRSFITVKKAIFFFNMDYPLITHHDSGTNENYTVQLLNKFFLEVHIMNMYIIQSCLLILSKKDLWINWVTLSSRPTQRHTSTSMHKNTHAHTYMNTMLWQIHTCSHLCTYKNTHSAYVKNICPYIPFFSDLQVESPVIMFIIKKS